MNIDKIISDLFKDRWTANLASAGIDKQKAQLYKTLKNQVEGYWSGHTAYHLAVDGGFLVDGKSNSRKKLTAVGGCFMDSYNRNWRNELDFSSTSRDSISKDEIKALALKSGFKLKPQEGGDMDLNEYVYKFAESLIARSFKLIGK